MLSLFTAALLAVVIDQDTTIEEAPVTGTAYTVVGDATLTIKAGVIGKVILQDNAGLVVDGADMKGETWVQGDNDIKMLSGRYRVDANIEGGGDANVYIASGFEWSSWIVFSGGTQHIEAHGSRGGRIIANNDAKVTADLYADDPWYMYNHVGLTTGSYCWEGACSSLWLSGVDWKLHDNNQVLDGDADGSGTVDLADLNLIRNNFGQVLAYGQGVATGDLNPYDGKIDLDDLNSVRNNFGASTTNVPEPPGLGMGVLAAAVLFGFYCMGVD